MFKLSPWREPEKYFKKIVIQKQGKRKEFHPSFKGRFYVFLVLSFEHLSFYLYFSSGSCHIFQIISGFIIDLSPFLHFSFFLSLSLSLSLSVPSSVCPFPFLFHLSFSLYFNLFLIIFHSQSLSYNISISLTFSCFLILSLSFPLISPSPFLFLCVPFVHLSFNQKFWFSFQHLLYHYHSISRSRLFQDMPNWDVQQLAPSRHSMYKCNCRAELMVRDLALTGNEYAYLVISETLIQDKRWDEDSGRVTSSPGGGKWEEAWVRNPDTRWDDAIGSNTCFSLVNIVSQ